MVAGLIHMHACTCLQACWARDQFSGGSPRLGARKGPVHLPCLLSVVLLHGEGLV